MGRFFTNVFNEGLSGESPSSITAEDQPVETVSWLDAARSKGEVQSLNGVSQPFVFPKHLLIFVDWLAREAPNSLPHERYDLAHLSLHGIRQAA